MKLVEENKRRQVLLKFGFKQCFIDVLDRIEKEDHLLRILINYPKGAYYYLPTIKDYTIYKGYQVVPICDSGQGDSFYVLLFNDHDQKIIYSEIEQDKVYVNYKININAFIVSILIEYYDLMDDEEIEDRNQVIEKLLEFGTLLGINKELVSRVMNRIFKADDNGENRFIDSQKTLEEYILPCLE